MSGIRDVAGTWPEKDSLQREPEEQILDTGLNAQPTVCTTCSCPRSHLEAPPLWTAPPCALGPGPSLPARRTCGALSGPLGVLSFVFGRWLWRTVGFSVSGASLSLLFVLPIRELPLRLSRALVNIEIASMLPRSQEREGGFSFPSPPPTLQGGPAHDSSALSQGRPSCSRAAALPHTTNNFEDRGRRGPSRLAQSYLLSLAVGTSP